jgi:hypothetical protein
MVKPVPSFPNSTMSEGLPRQRLAFVPIDTSRDPNEVLEIMRRSKLTDLQIRELFISLKEQHPEFEYGQI